MVSAGEIFAFVKKVASSGGGKRTTPIFSGNMYDPQTGGVLEGGADAQGVRERATAENTKAERLKQKQEAALLKKQADDVRKLEEARLLAEKNGPKLTTLPVGQFAKFMRTNPTSQQIDAYLKRHGG